MNDLDARIRSLRQRLPIAAIVVGLTVAYWLWGGLSAAAAALGLVSIAAAMWLWPENTPQTQPAPLPSPPATPEPEPKPEPSFAPDLASVMEAVPDPAMILSPALIIVVANASAREQLSVKPGVHVSLALRSPDLLAAVEDARRTRTSRSAEIRFAVPVERALTVHVSPVSQRDGDTGMPSLILVFRDRTEEQQIAQLRADFVANASHELRTPLASVKGFIETLQGAAKNDAAARERFLSIMHTEASRMSRLIDDLLSLSRVEMREHVAPRDPVDLAGIADEIIRVLEPVAQKAGQRLLVEIDARPAIVRGDRDELVQLLQNLAQNAIKYGRQGGDVTVKIRHAGQRIELSVADQGIGIAPEHLPRLTERFYRVSAKDSRERGGTGLGLAIVKHIVNRHRGEMRIVSTLGQGSAFTVSLPRPEAGN